MTAAQAAADEGATESFYTLQDHERGLPLGSLLAHHAAADPQAPAVTVGDITVRYGELDRRSSRRARALAALGVGMDDFVTIALPNGLEFYETCFAVWKLGATVNPVSWRLPDTELAAIVELTDPKLVVGVDPARVPGRAVLPAGYQPDPMLSDAPLPVRVARYWRAMTSGGSTGRPKVIVDHMPARWDPKESFALQKVGDTILNPGPLYHNGPFMYAIKALFAGGHVVEGGKFDPLGTLSLVEKHRINWVMFVPTMMNRIWRLPEEERARFDLSSLRVMFHTAAPCAPWLKQAWIEWLGPERIWEGYGGTEAQGGAIIGGVEWLEHPGSVGRAFPGTEMRVFAEDGSEAPAGEVGEVFFKSRPEAGATYHYIGAEPRAVGEWESIGDLGYMDAEGYLYLADRRTDLVISAGANIYPAEVEAAIDSHPDVVASVVIGLPDDDLGQRVHAIVQPRGGPDGLDAERLTAHLKQVLTITKLPRSFEFVEGPLRGDDGKVRRSALRADRIAAAS